MRLGIYVLMLAIALSSGSHAESLSDRDIKNHPQVKGAIAVVDAWIDSVRDYGQVPGISVGFVVDQDLVFAKGYGYSNLENAVKAGPETIYSICSISKLFTSIGVMQMRDAGVLTLRDPVSEHLDWFDIENENSGSGPVRVGALLTHSSGLPRESDFPYWTKLDFPFPKDKQLKKQLEKQSMLYPADTRFQYSNLGFALAGAVLSARAETSYEKHVSEKIIQPMGLEDTRTHFPTSLHGKQMAIGYAGLLRDRIRKPLPPFETRAITSAAGFTSTIEDLARFASWNFRTLNNQDDLVLSGNTLREMQRVSWVDPDWKTSWGLGFRVSQYEENTVVGHGGGCPGYITDIAMVPKHKVAAIALTNAADGPAGNITASMLKVIGMALMDVGDMEAPILNLDLDQYAGNFSTPIWGGEIAVRVWGNELSVISLGNPYKPLGEIQKLTHLEDNVFVRLEDGEPREKWYFQMDETGRASEIKRHQGLYSRVN